MKKLADGTEVPLDTPTKMTSKGRVLLTPEEIAEREAEEQAWIDAAPEREAEATKAELSQTDKDMARVSEDILDLLISKGLFTESELPPKAQETLNKRKQLRSKL